MTEEFHKVCEHIFSNWTALKLAVEHSMGGPESRNIALQCIDYMVNYCLNESKEDVNNVQEALEDILDEEFETICEDGSTREVAEILVRFLCLISSNNIPGFQEEFSKLPPIQDWLIKPQGPTNNLINNRIDESDDSSDAQSDIPEPKDMEWTVVKTRKKR